MFSSTFLVLLAHLVPVYPIISIYIFFTVYLYVIKNILNILIVLAIIYNRRAYWCSQNIDRTRQAGFATLLNRVYI